MDQYGSAILPAILKAWVLSMRRYFTHSQTRQISIKTQVLRSEMTQCVDVGLRIELPEILRNKYV